MNILETAQQELESLFPAEEPVEQVAPEDPPQETEEEEAVIERKPGVLVTDYAVHGSHLDVLCGPEQVVAVAKLLDKNTFFLESISGADWLKKEQLEVIYDFSCFEKTAFRITVRTYIPRSNPVVPSISSYISGADWHERETFDFYGIIFDGHPNLTRILLPEDADFFPLLKDYMP
jgi:NADH-quinone oxidoreductase subunit C